MDSLSETKFEYLTPIQALTLPIALKGHDVAGQGQTGTGKTAAFLVAVMQRLLTEPPRQLDRKPKGAAPRALILAPTRELAIQIEKDAILLGSKTGLKFALAYGGVDYEKQRSKIEQGVDILIGTPGRIIDYFKQGVYHLQGIQSIVLDEADRMFDLGFIKDIRYVLRRLPKPDQRLGLLFSATLSYKVLELAYEHMNQPEKVAVESDHVTADRVRQVIYFPANNEKLPLLIGLIRAKDPGRTMVFSNTKMNVDRITRTLDANGLNAAALSGDVPQKKRQSLLKRFHAGEIDILVATDVAARGLHIPDVSHVINYDLPDNAEDYVHRIGRTARLGADGDAISFACEDYAFALPEIEAYVGRKIPSESVDPALLADITTVARRSRPPRGGRPQNRSGGSGGGGGRRRR